MNKELLVSDLVQNAPNAFIDICNKIELEQDLNKRAELAQNYIKENSLITTINQKVIGMMLENIDLFPIELWRNLYLIERSSVPRNKDISWFNRIIMFYDTFIHENNIVNNAMSPLGTKFYFIKGPKDHPTFHDSLTAGRGENLPDFYFYDSNKQGKMWDKMVKVEHKYCPFDSLEDAANYYKNHHSYGVNYLTLYKEGQGYFLVDYLNNNISKLLVFNGTQLQKPQGLINF